MNAIRAFAVLLAAAPAMAMAQSSYSQAQIVGERPLIRESLRICTDRTYALDDRKALLELDKADADREGAAIAREGSRLGVELRNLNNMDTAAVAAYNARSDAHNARVQMHNRRVGDLNDAVSLLNRDGADVTAYCNARFARR